MTPDPTARPPMSWSRTTVAAFATLTCLASGGCEPGAGASADAPDETCRVVQMPQPLGGDLGESSGVALGGAGPDRLWSHNDSGDEPVLYAVRPDGSLLGAMDVAGAEHEDWEDIASGRCDGATCLYIGDFGDNEGERADASIYRVREPEPDAGESPPARRFRFVYPGGPRDAEAMFVLPGERVFVITKGRNSNVAVYRYPGALRDQETVELEHVVDLTREEAELADQVTGAAATPDGRWIAVRSYANLYLFRPDRLLESPTPTPDRIFDLSPLRESQGEAVAITEAGRVILTSERVANGEPGMISILDCPLPSRD